MKKSTLNIWQTHPSCKVLKQKEYDKTPVKALSVKLYGNETESVHFYITPEKSVSSLQVSVANTHPSINLSVGYVWYVNVQKSSAGTASEKGLYPDALLPFAVAQKQGLNRINTGENQEIYITVQTDESAAAGEYHTEITVVADGEITVLPLTITVWDYVLPKKNHTRQYFIIDSEHLSLVEDNIHFQAYKKYYEQLLDYRVNGSRMPFSLKGDYRSVLASYIENLRIYYADERITVFNLPVFYTEAHDDVDYERTGYSFREVLKACIKDGVDYFEKAVTYLWILDEPHLTPAKIGYCKTVLPKFERLKDAISAECLNGFNGAGDSELKKRVARSVKNMPNVITSGINGKILPTTPEEYHITWCPAFDSLAQNESFKMTRTLNKGEKWWYGCNWPVPPYPTYHIDDTFLSPRVLSWIQYAYNITGNLYWRINYWAKKQDGELIYVDPYQQSTYPTTNGEGMLVYPGSKLGVDGFIPSIRLEAIRDGIEDFEALYCLQEKLDENAQRIGERDVSVNELLQPLYTRLFTQTMILPTAGDWFEKGRETVANLLVAASRYAFSVSSFDKEKKSLRFFADGVTVSAIEGSLEKQGSVYTVTANGDLVRLALQDSEGSQTEIEIFVTEEAHSPKYALSDCWAKTVQTYQVQNCTPENIVKPYYDLLDDTQNENKYPCCAALSGLVGFVWRTETAIVKRQKGDKWEVELTIPRGTLKMEEAYQTEALDEQAKRYSFTTDKQSVTLEVENEKGTYTAELYIY